MDLKINLEQYLWEAIQKNYENESYSSAILDAIHLLTETIRNKTGLEGDGASLIGQAFGGENPKILLNKLQTESEKNIQKGIQDILRGFYTAIRNPRSHDKFSDSKDETDSIIYFIGYLLKLIDKSKMNFEESNFLNRVFDDYYVKDKVYSDLLVNEIPKRQRVNIAISVLLQRQRGDIYNLKFFMQSLFDKLESIDILRVYKVVSEELKYKNLDGDIHPFLHILPPEHWGKIDKAVKIRIENMLFENVKSGKYDSVKNKTRLGALGTWIHLEHLKNFDYIDKWTPMIISKVRKGDEEERKYVEKFFWSAICRLNYNNIDYWLQRYFSEGLENKNMEIVKSLQDKIEYDKEHPWWEVFEKELKEYPDIKFTELPF
jgi:uncharacterized protein (TIGR02391 family)